MPRHRQHFRRRAAAGRDGFRGLEPGRPGRELHAVGRGSRAAAEPQPVVQAIAPGILVVDDSITSRSLERSILEAHGYRVRVAVDGLEALEMLRVEKADLIITDIQMPRLDGFGLVEALKADSRLKGIPVIIVSSLERRRGSGTGSAAGRGRLRGEAQVRSDGVAGRDPANDMNGAMKKIRVMIVEDSAVVQRAARIQHRARPAAGGLRDGGQRRGCAARCSNSSRPT